MMLLATICLLAPMESTLNENQLKSSDENVSRIYVIRHGESAFNVPNEDGIKLTSGKSITIPLTEEGKKQATDLGKRLAQKFPENTEFVVYASTAWRAQETANRVFDELKTRHSVQRGKDDENFLEMGKGVWEGKPKDEKFDASYEKWKVLSPKDKYTTPKLETGESFQEVGDRMLKGLEKISSNKTIIVVSHYDAMNSLALRLSDCILSEEPFPQITLDNGDMLLIEIPKGGKPKVTMHIKSMDDQEHSSSSKL